MSKVTLELNVKQVENLVEELSLEDKLAIIRKISMETWQLRFKRLLSRIDSRLKNRRTLSNEEIVHIVKNVRKHAKHA